MNSEDMSIRERRVLTREGFRYKGMRWNSPCFQGVRDWLCADTKVAIRIDPMDPRHAHIYDERKQHWVRGDLVTKSVDDGRNGANSPAVHDELFRVAQRLARLARYGLDPVAYDPLTIRRTRIASVLRSDIGATTSGAPSAAPSNTASPKD
jgi:hypothetical protein